MRILVFGAGALGTLYAVRLARAGHEVALLARGTRLEALRRDAPRIRRRGARETETAEVQIVERIADAPHDLVVVLVRRHQLDAALPLLAAEVGDESDVLVMVNLARGYDALRAALGARLLVGFAGAAASFAEDGVLEHQIAPALFQPTVLGEPDGASTPRVLRIAVALSEAGFPVRVRDDMEAWQESHAAWITPFMLATAAAAQDPARFIERAHVRLWMNATKEALRLVRASRGRLSPRGLGAAAALPTAFLVALVRLALAPRGLRTHVVATGLDSRSEGLALADDLAVLAAEARATLPHLDRLRALVDRT
jgi:2-dehydropantoate 2-reductase